MSIDGQKKFLHESVGFTSHRDFLNRLDEMMTCQAQWQDTFVSEERAGAEWGTDLKYWKRDPLAILQEILENPALADKCVWRPRRVFSGEGSRVYGDMDTGKFWWQTQVALVPDIWLIVESNHGEEQGQLHRHPNHFILRQNYPWEFEQGSVGLASLYDHWQCCRL